MERPRERDRMTGLGADEERKKAEPLERATLLSQCYAQCQILRKKSDNTNVIFFNKDRK